MNLKKTAYYLFWYAGVPLMALIAGWTVYHHQFLFDNSYFYFAFLICAPHIMLKTGENDQKALESFVAEFRLMTTLDFAETEMSISRMPTGKNKSILKEAYEIAYQERYRGREKK